MVAEEVERMMEEIAELRRRNAELERLADLMCLIRSAAAIALADQKDSICQQAPQPTRRTRS